MRVRVRLFATLSHYLHDGAPGVGVEVDLPEEATVAGLLGQLGVPLDEARMIFVNGRARPPDWTLQPGDEVGVFPPIGGG